MAITDRVLKLLWGRSAGRCAAPNCAIDLMPLVAKSGDVILGEMAHVIGRKPGSARSDKAVGTDDEYDNLILLCANHHVLVDKAPEDHPAELLRTWKRNWEVMVEGRLKKLASANHAEPLEMRLWTYFNFDLILQLSRNGFSGEPLKRLQFLQASGALDADGFPLNGGEVAGIARTVFETWPQSMARVLQQFYASLVEQAIDANSVLDLDEVWGVRKLQTLLFPGAFGFINRGCAFKTTRQIGEREERSVRCRAKGIELAFQIDTWNTYSNSSLTVHFTGWSQIAALLLIRSVERQTGGDRTKLAIKATPIALGTGFWPAHDRTPRIALERECSDYSGTQADDLSH